MRKLFAALIIFAIAFCLFSSVSGVANESSWYISKELLRNREFFDNEDSEMYLGDSICIAISGDLSTAMITLTYNGVEFLGTAIGDVEEINADELLGYVGYYDGTLESVDANNTEYIQVDLTATFTDKDVYAVVSVGILSDKGMPNVGLYGNFSNELSAVSKKNAENSLLRMQDQIITEIDCTQQNVEPTSTDLDMRVGFRGSLASIASGYEFFNISSFHQSNLINGQSAQIYAKLNTSSESFLEYMRDVEGYDNLTVGLAVSAYPKRVELSICGNHERFSLENNGCSPTSGQTSVDLIIPVYSQTSGVSLTSVPAVFSSVTLTKGTYANGCLNGQNLANWILVDNFWDDDALDGDHTTQSGVSVSADMKYNDYLTQSVFRSISITGKVRYAVNIQGVTETLTFTITTEEISRTTTMIVYPATAN